MKPILRPTSGPDDWRAFLAEPDKQWKPGFSAHSLAHCWETAAGIPNRVQSALESSRRLRGFELLLAIPEVKVDLPGGRRPSQTDLWLLGRLSDGLVSVAVEGKVSEPFGPTIAEWQSNASQGKAKRLAFLFDALHLNAPVSPELRYQLLHRTASAILLAHQYHAKHAVLLIHSFSTNEAWIDDYRAFAQALGASGGTEGVIEIPSHNRPTLSLVWVRDTIADEWNPEH